jgi:putative endonuclease
MHRKPLELIYYEACLNEGDAKQREKYLKSGMGKKYLRYRINWYVEFQNRAFDQAAIFS